MAVHLQIDIVSDFVCPWCWLGWKQFQSSGVKADVAFRPYQLDPLAPESGGDYQSFMAERTRGNEERYAAMREHLEAKGPEYGIRFRFDDQTYRPNTLRAHRLLRWAAGQDLGTKCATALFKAHFEELHDIGNVDVLVAIAEDLGLDSELTRELLDSDRDGAEVQEEIAFFRRLGVSGVPTFIYNGEQALSGAQDPSAHRDLAKQIRKSA